MVFTDKHLLNNPTSLVIESLQGLIAINPHLALDVKNKVVYRAQTNKSHVSLICGGGSGHEPHPAGFIGEGMLTAAVAGNVFASPNASQVTKAIELVDGDKGTLIIVKNYTGDVLNFGLSKEQYAASHPEKASRVKFLIVGEDVSVGKTQGGLVGRRGLAGTVLVYKIAGALAARGADLDAVYDVAEWVSQRIGTIGVGLDHCHVPGTAASASPLSSTEIEIGMGIHNEPGYTHVSPIPPLSQLISSLLDLLTSRTDPDRSFLPFGKSDSENEVVLLTNNLGGLSELEIGSIAREAVLQLGGRGIKVQRLLVGPFMTSLNMPGFSLTLLLLPWPGESAPYRRSDILSLLDDKADTPGWKWSSQLPPAEFTLPTSESLEGAAAIQSTQRKLVASNPVGFLDAIQRAALAIIKNEPELTDLDRIVGDGDAGLTLKSGAEHILRAVHDGEISGEDVIGSVTHIANIVGESMDGTGGALYSIFFSALAQGLYHSGSEAKSLTLAVWTGALRTALSKLFTYTRARPPSRTLIDPLSAFVQGLEDISDLKSAVAKAAEAAENTKVLDARAGRAAYVEKEKVKGVMDPGAQGVRLILEALVT